MTKTHGNTHGGDKRGKATLKSELKKLRYVGGTLVVAKHKRDASNGSKKTGTRLRNRAAHRALGTLVS
jgi:hypothetical protein